jgi:[glutamine synthetase] adenylyltransferase / [glutamine synthetase]-adenylyl-L-tyrosine phosphorylase
MRRRSDWIQKKAAKSLRPSQVEQALVQLSESWPSGAPDLADLVEKFPMGEAALLHLLAMSGICATRLSLHPEMLLWLSRPEIALNQRSYAEMLGALRRSTEESIAADNFRALRLWKSREMTRIALRELADAADLEETTAELSQLAEISVTEVYTHWNAQLRANLGSPAAEFTVVALGKLGGRELNHSSDIDLLFLYSSEGQVSPRVSNHEWFNQLAEKILATFATTDSGGSLFRIDLRLRPEGSAGPLARSLESMENYYAGFGETWERLALIKAREICGSRELAYEFLQLLQSFMYPRSPTPDLFEEIANIKRRIERDVVGADKLERNVKLGRGGIREIEFVVQTLQFVHGAQHTFLQETNTLRALHALAQLELIPRREVLDLDRAYRFLRRVEHRLQIDAEQQIHTVPEEPQALERLALSLGFASAQQFTAALKETMTGVRAVFQRVTTKAPSDAPIALGIFTDQKKADKALNDLARGSPGFHVAPRTRQVFRKLRPLLLDWLGKAADPDVALNQLVRFVEAYGLRSLLFELLVTNPKLLELLIKTFDASRFASDLLIRRPQLLEEITRDTTFYEPRSMADNLRRLDSLGVDAANLDPVRAYRQRQLLRIILRDVLGLAAPASIFAELSDLAEACLVFTNSLLDGENLTIIALGKFGGREINYGADLDVVFIGDDSRAAQSLIVAMTSSSPEGNVAALDARLRPDGEKGPLVCSLEACEAYYQQRAQLWEIHALTRARPISGPLQQPYIEMVRRIWAGAGRQRDLLEKIDNMLERIREGRGSGSDFVEFKTGVGGLIEAEFLVQALQMKSGVWDPNWGDALRGLGEQNLLSTAEIESAASSYDFLRRCATALRRWEDKSVSTLPADSVEQKKLAHRLGCKDIDAFNAKYKTARETIHALYVRHVKNRP